MMLPSTSNWITWAEVHDEAPESLRSKMPAADTDDAALEPAITRILAFSAEWAFMMTGAQYTGPGPWRYEPLPERCTSCGRLHHIHGDIHLLAGAGRGYVSATCIRAKYVELGPAPVVTIETVTVDGEQLDEADWGLARGQFLYRTDGANWPDIPTAFGSFPMTVDYIAGPDVPVSLRRVAATIARALVRAHLTSEVNHLPAYWRSIVRDGFTVQARGVTDQQIREGWTGLDPLIDSVIGQFPTGRGGTPRVAVPGVARPDQQWIRRAVT